MTRPACAVCTHDARTHIAGQCRVTFTMANDQARPVKVGCPCAGYRLPDSFHLEIRDEARTRHHPSTGSDPDG